MTEIDASVKSFLEEPQAASKRSGARAILRLLPEHPIPENKSVIAREAPQRQGEAPGSVRVFPRKKWISFFALVNSFQ